MRNLSVALCCLASISATTAAWGATMEEADRLFADQQWSEAAVAYRSVAAADKTNPTAWFRLGLSMLRLEDYAGAKKPFDRALKHGFQPPAAVHFNRARVYAATGNTPRALADLEAWIAGGGGAFQAAMGVPELRGLHDDERFLALIEPLRPCTAPEYRQFDFWLGDWDVTTPATPGRVSHNSITSTNGGCTLMEQYDTPGGYTGSSLNFYDAARKKWHQTWIDNQGAPLYMEGEFDGESMVLATTGDPVQINRVTWTPLADGRVRQHWEATADGGETWSTVFDGYYSKRQPQ